MTFLMNCAKMVEACFQDPFARFFPLAPGFSPVTQDGVALSAVLTAFFQTVKAVETAWTPRPPATGLKPGANETDMADGDCILETGSGKYLLCPP
jgi:hypothetical protein